MLAFEPVKNRKVVLGSREFPIVEAEPLLRNGQRDWASLTDDELVSHAQSFVEQNGIRSRSGLDKADQGLYRALLKRKLIERIGLENSNVGDRNWASMSDGELVGFARKFVGEREITGRKDLGKADRGLHAVLRRRKLIDAVGLAEKLRNWASMSDGELVGFAKTFVDEKKITGRSELAKADSRLYYTLKKRKLIDAVFAPIEQKKKDELLGQLAEAVDAYTEKN
jgi:hypothetical protein